MSSNRYANGNNQNCGMDDAATKNPIICSSKHQAQSTLIPLFYDSRITYMMLYLVPHRILTLGNVITDRSTTRLHAPPGGGSQLGFLFGGDDSNPAKSRNQKNQASQPMNVLKERNQVPAPSTQPVQKGSQPPTYQANNMPEQLSSNKYANGANQNCGRQPAT
jgi:hypothetical protein